MASYTIEEAAELFEDLVDRAIAGEAVVITSPRGDVRLVPRVGPSAVEPTDD